MSEAFHRIAAGGVASCPVSAEFGVDGYVVRYEKHFVYWKTLNNGDIGVVAVLLERMRRISRIRKDSGYAERLVEQLLDSRPTRGNRDRVRRRPGHVDMAKFTTLDDALAEYLRDGDHVAFEGFSHLIPFAVAHEAIRQKRRNLVLFRMTPDLVYD